MILVDGWGWSLATGFLVPHRTTSPLHRRISRSSCSHLSFSCKLHTLHASTLLPYFVFSSPLSRVRNPSLAFAVTATISDDPSATPPNYHVCCSGTIPLIFGIVSLDEELVEEDGFVVKDDTTPEDQYINANVCFGFSTSFLFPLLFS